MNGIRCHICGKFMSYNGKFAYILERGPSVIDLEPPEEVSVHPKCAGQPLGKED